MLNEQYKQIYFLIVTAFCFVLFSFPVAAGGIPDTSFGNGGKVRFSFSAGSEDLAQSAALQPDGKIILVGWSSPAGQGDCPNQR